MYGQSRDNQIFLEWWVTKFSKVWGSSQTQELRSIPYHSETVIGFPLIIIVLITVLQKWTSKLSFTFTIQLNIFKGNEALYIGQPSQEMFELKHQ